MVKVYVGNLSQEATEGEIRKLFEHNKIPPLSIARFDGYAFVDVETQEMVEKAIEKLHDYNLLGSVLIVEQSVPKTKRPRSNIIMVHNIPLSVELSVIENLLSGFGKVVSCSKGREGSNGYSVQVRFENPDEARKAIDDLNKHELEGNTLRVKYRNNTRQQNGGNKYGNQQRQNLPNDFDFPVRLLVPSDMVGALIGTGGETIRKVTHETRARVDIHRRENPGSQEKAVTIFGKPEYIDLAVKSLMTVMVEESQKKEKSGDLPLKLLVHNSLVGRLIGKGGKSLKNIMEDASAKITISPMHELTICNPERIVTVYGTVDQCAKAEEMITKKLRKAYENYMQANQRQSHNMFPGLNYMGLFAGNDMGPPMGYQPQQFNNHPMAPQMEQNYEHEGGYVRQGTLPGLYYPSQPGVYGGPQQRIPADNVPQSETCIMYVPKESVGPIIGVKGENIKASAQHANASIKISPADSDTAAERRIVIKGGPHSQWKAQFAIFDKIRNEGIFGDREVHLSSEITVPAKIVGRIIGRGGSNVRELQRLSGAHIEVPPNENTGGAGDQVANNRDENEEVVVKITGHFYANQAAQRRIRQLQQEVVEREAYRRYYNRGRGGYVGGRGGGGGRGGYRNRRNGGRKSKSEGESDKSGEEQ